jgi:hypothetical protein
MQKQFVFKALAFAILPSLLLLPGIAHANNVAVNCPGASLNDAVAALPPGPNTITVTGACNENVSITNVRSLTIIAGAGGAKIVQPQDSDTFDIVRSQDITLQGLEIVGVPGSGGFFGAGVNITEASDVSINRGDIHDNQGGGVVATNGSLLILNNTNIHNNNPFDGLDVLESSTADVRRSTIQNNGSPGGLTDNAASVTGGVGAFVASNSVARFRLNTIIQNNADAGIVARGLSFVALNAATIQGHNIDGIVVQQGGHLQFNGPALIQGNGGACAPGALIPCGGIFAAGDATVDFSGFGTVSGNHGAGIFIEEGSNLHLNGATISNNTGDGVHIRWLSTADLRDFGGGPNTITGNGGASVFCDERSLVIGKLKVFSKVKCEIENE